MQITVQETGPTVDGVQLSFDRVVEALITQFRELQQTLQHLEDGQQDLRRELQRLEDGQQDLRKELQQERELNQRRYVLALLLERGLNNMKRNREDNSTFRHYNLQIGGDSLMDYLIGVSGNDVVTLPDTKNLIRDPNCNCPTS